MKYFLQIIFLFLFSKTFSQDFEGKIIYSNHFTSKTESVTAAQLEAIIGGKQEYLIKGGNYKSFLNGQSITMQQYDYRTNRIYNKTPKSDTLYWFDASINTDEVISFEVKRNLEMILDNLCDAIIMKTRTSTITIFYCSRYKIDSKLYEKHLYSNWAFYVEKTNSLPLKTIIETNNFKMESVASEIIPLKFDSEYFNIDSKTPIKKS